MLNTKNTVARWLDNFAPDDQAVAAELLTNVDTVDASEFRGSLVRLVENELTEAQGPTLLLPARSVRERSLFAGEYSRDQELEIVDDQQDAGSEHIVGQFLRDVARSHPDVITAPTSLADLRQHKVRHVVIVDDVIGSGNRIESYTRDLCGHPTMQSWRSLGYFGITVCVYASTRTGLTRIKRLPQLQNVRCAIRCKTIRDDLPPRLQPETIRICTDYARRTFRRKGGWTTPLGYRGAGTLLLFAHGAPNTSPAIFWQEHGPSATGEQWSALAPKWVVGADLLSGGPSRLVSAESPFELLADQLERSHAPANLLMVLDAIKDGASTPQEIRHLTTVDITTIERMIGSLLELGLIDHTRQRLTQAGRDEIEHAMRRPMPRSWVRAPTPGDETPDNYYPQSLTGR